MTFAVGITGTWGRAGLWGRILFHGPRLPASVYPIARSYVLCSGTQGLWRFVCECGHLAYTGRQARGPQCPQQGHDPKVPGEADTPEGEVSVRVPGPSWHAALWELWLHGVL